jgi:hypothetical protein
MDLAEIGPEDVERIHLAQDRVKWRVLVNTVMNLGFHKRQNFLSSLAIVSFSIELVAVCDVRKPSNLTAPNYLTAHFVFIDGSMGEGE